MAIVPFGSTSATQWGFRPQIFAEMTGMGKFASSKHKLAL